MRRPLLALSFGLLMTGAAFAQAPAKPAAPVDSPDAATLKTAREVVGKMQGDRTAVLASMGGPMVGLMQQMGMREPERAQVLAQEVVLPVMSAHYDALLDVQARSYASVLSGADLQAVSAFYDTPAGRALAQAQPQLAQAQLAGMTQWLGSLVPEIQSKAVQAIKAHGWDKAPAQAR